MKQGLTCHMKSLRCDDNGIIRKYQGASITQQKVLCTSKRGMTKSRMKSQYPPAYFISLSLSPPVFNYGNQFCLGIFDQNIQVFLFLLQCYFSQSFLSLLCFLLSVPFSPFWNPYSSHLRIPDAALHISYLLPHDLILFIFLLF